MKFGFLWVYSFSRPWEIGLNFIFQTLGGRVSKAAIFLERYKMAQKKGIYLHDDAIAIIGEANENGTLSGRINQIITRYGAITKIAQRELRGILNDPDWFILRAACISWATRGEPPEILITGLALEIEDGGHAGEFGDAEWKPTLEKIKNFTPTQILAIIEILELD